MMGSLSLRALAVELGARYSGPELTVAGVATDSRRVVDGDLYVALQGDRFDGHEFIAEVAANGAVAAIVSSPVQCALPQLTVADTREALGLVARVNRRRFDGPLVGVTGSAGKTTCKEMVAAILEQCGATLATQGNLNNEIGVPLTLLRLAPEHRYAVIEMGAARAGDIAYLCRFAEPDIAIVTSALPAHLEGFGSLETVASTKGELFSGLRPDGTAVVNVDDPYAPLWHKLAGGRRIVTFGLGDGAMFSARRIEPFAQGLHFELVSPEGSVAVELHLLGQHNVRNALAAAAAASAAGAGLEAISAGLGRVRPVAGRLQPRRGRHGNTVIDDSYNANPGAVKAAIDVLAEFPGRRRLILGNMAELGSSAGALHREVAQYAGARGIDELWTVGPWAEAMAEEFKRAGNAAGARVFADNDAVLAACRQADDSADVVLVKGSRSAGLEVVVAVLCDDVAGGGAD